MTRNIDSSVAGSFTEVEEAFFRAGDEGEFSPESGDDHEAAPRASLWARLSRPVTVREDDDEEWDWQIAIVRARVDQ